MKFLSFKYLFNNALKSLKRFPLVILFAFVGVVLSLILIEYDDEIKNKLPYINSLLSSALGVPLFFCLSVYSNKNNLTNKLLYILYGIAFLVLILIYLSLPSIEDTHSTSVPYIRYGVFNVIIHLLVSFTPFVKTKELNGFWNYNKTLFIRLCTSVLYSFFIYVGLILAIFAVKELFNVNVHDELYLDIYIITIGLFNTWFFVAGIPEDLNQLETIKTYPKGLKIFSQYVLLPLLMIYLVILYIYVGKIIFYWNWPKGIVSYLISGVSILGFFNILLIYPYGKTSENEWIQKFSRAFYILLTPLLIVLFIAICMRINDYGITIKRYAAFALGIWISLVCLYFILKKNNIKFIPISLAIILALVSFGPWGMFTISEKSQVHRLKEILEHNHILVDGKIKNEVIWAQDSLPKFYAEKKLTNNNILTDSVHNEVKSIIDYLDDHHGFKQIRPWFTQDIDAMISSETNHRYSYNNEAKKYMESMGLKYQKHYSWRSNRSYTYGSPYKKVIETKGYDYYYSFSVNKKNTKSFNIGNQKIQISRKNKVLYLTTNKDSVVLNISKIHQELYKTHGKGSNTQIPKEQLTQFFKTSKLDIKLEIERLHFSYKNDTLELNSISGDLFFKEKE
ncbi:DUF4153 domain-containing protein [Wenyingzhuangia aestuarii]|uniref:DUF4153 domain-containing protein n=1 Tax=Wenyingzhuangia aestuarii TaxID=1647582 RepID=UPI00143C00CE|nr:DUF4153 domain-containing protein [Wenyingzhuangia aestuarii]NJB81441.1 hypothetical protein [Wenyingzhuangia aestuarii]